MKLTIKPIWMWGWTHEGILYRKNDWVVMKPSSKKPSLYRLRKKGSGEGPANDPGEGDFYSRKEAFKKGNKNVKNHL
jgi:hypothetical protein